MDDVVDGTLLVKGIRIGWQLVIADNAVELQPEFVRGSLDGRLWPQLFQPALHISKKFADMSS